MNDKLLEVHPDLKPFVKKMPSFKLHKRNLRLIRALVKLMPGSNFHGDPTVKNVYVRRLDGESRIRLRVYRPVTASAPAPGLVWFHGGGYVIGKPEMDDAACAEYVRRTGISVFSVQYRCAPEHPFPAGLDDAYAALAWVAANAQDLGIDPARIAVGGASAGAGLAASLVQLANDRGTLPVAFQLLVYPMLDDRTSFRPDPAPENGIAWSHANNRFGWESCLGTACAGTDVPQYAVPARREDLSGLPPAWIGVGTADIFHEENVAYAERLRASGVECDLVIVPGAFHGFDVIARQAPVVRDFREAQIAALKARLFV